MEVLATSAPPFGHVLGHVVTKFMNCIKDCDASTQQTLGLIAEFELLNSEGPVMTCIGALRKTAIQVW